MRVSRSRDVFFYVIVVLCWAGGIAQAAEDPASRSELQMVESQSSTSLSRWALFGGVGGGYGLVSGSDYSGSIGGGQFLLSGLGSFQIPRWSFDLGMSWFYSQLNGNNAQNLPLQIKTRSALIDAGARYRIGEHWQVGPALNLAFGTDTSFTPQIGDANSTIFLGLKGVYEFLWQKFPVRLWAQLSKDLSAPKDDALLALVGIQIGIPLFQAKEPMVKSKETLELTSIHDDQIQDQVRVSLDPQRVFFSSNSAELKPEVKKILDEVGDYLKDDQDNWSTLEIVGHADQRGKFQYNLKLSERRAQAVQKELIAMGAKSEKLKYQAMSFLKPLENKNSKEAWAKNRRVELIFNHVKDPKLLIKKLEPLTRQGPWDAQWVD